MLKMFLKILKMLQNAYLGAKIGGDPAENEPRKEWSCPGPRVAASSAAHHRGAGQVPVPVRGAHRRRPSVESFASYVQQDYITRRSVIAVVRRLFKMGRKMVERRLKHCDAFSREAWKKCSRCLKLRDLFSVFPLLLYVCFGARSAEIFWLHQSFFTLFLLQFLPNWSAQCGKFSAYWYIIDCSWVFLSDAQQFGARSAEIF